MKKILKMVSANLLWMGLLISPIIAKADIIPSGKAVTLYDIVFWIELLATIFMSLATVFMVVYFVWAGITYMRAGSGEGKKVTEAKSMFWTGVVGALIIMGVGVILNTIGGIVTRRFFFY